VTIQTNKNKLSNTEHPSKTNLTIFNQALMLGFTEKNKGSLPPLLQTFENAKTFFYLMAARQIV
jgi:hypothetical protein